VNHAIDVDNPGRSGTLGQVQSVGVCVIGSFPPAASGQASVNAWFVHMAEQAGANVSTIDLSPRPGPATLRRRASRIPKVLIGLPRLMALLARKAVSSVYLGVAGGYGQIYDVVFASLIRLSGVPLFLHHDSYAYLQKRRRLTSMLVRIAGLSTTHIVLCEDMKERLIELYGLGLHVVVISGAANIDPPTNQPRARTELKTIGFISHLTRSKGVLEFLEVAERVRMARPDVRALLAGAITEPHLAAVIHERLRGAPWITYLGPIPAETKSRFYEDIDVFVFPTRYENEADPAVINEALAHGVVVVAPGRGCIGSVIAGGGGAVIRDDADFVSEAESLLLEWCQDPALFSSISAAALANSARQQADQAARLQALMGELVSAPRRRSTTRS
jgi:glycosyltransferase involved in cell wall biosynthesis